MLLLLSAAGLCSCDGGRLSVVSSDFGTLSTGEQTTLYTLTNRSGARMTVCDYGARIVSIQVPDRDGVLGDVVMGYGDIASFEKGAERFMGLSSVAMETGSTMPRFPSMVRNTNWCPMNCGTESPSSVMAVPRALTALFGRVRPYRRRIGSACDSSVSAPMVNRVIPEI